MLQRQFLPHYFYSPPSWRVWLRRFASERALPDFCMIGPPKSGTSDLAVTIMSHPNIITPLLKEFSSSDPQEWRPYYPTLSAVRRHMRRHGVALCPFVAPYLHRIDIPIILAAIRPETKIVITLRNPAELIFSDWKWHLLHRERRLVEKVPFLTTFAAFVDKALELFPELPVPFYPGLHCGIYANSVSQWILAFGKKNVRVCDVADYFRDRNAYLLRLEAFLGLPHVPLPQHLPVANRNPVEVPMADPASIAKLREFFEPYNRRLWNVIGTTYSW
jgi:hypothetical protein